MTYLRETAGVEHLVVAALGEVGPEDDVVPNGSGTEPGQGGHEADTTVVEQLPLLPLQLAYDGQQQAALHRTTSATSRYK